MRLYRITITPGGRFGTPVRSDTIFGHACWAVAVNEGEKAVSAMAERCKKGEPDVVFSDGFPAGFLPLPFVVMTRILSVKSPTKLKERQEWKRIKKSRWIKRSHAEECNWDPEKFDFSFCYADMPLEQPLLRNIIDRYTGTSLKENGLFQVTSLWFSGIWSEIDIYAMTVWSKDRLHKVMQWIFEAGYGRDSTTGCGTVSDIRIAEDDFPEYAGSLCFMSLSRFVPCNTVDITRSRWALEAKYGRTWQAAGSANPFKKPVMQTVPGSVFVATTRRGLYGKVLENIHTDPSVIDNCMTIPYWLPY